MISDKKQSTRVRSGSFLRVPGESYSTAEEVFEAAMLMLVPDDQTQRKAFGSLMPYLYVLRNKGCSWEQLTKLLSDCGFKLQTSTVRSYFSELLAERMDICKERMNEQIVVLAEVRKASKGADLFAMSEKVAAIMEKQRCAAPPTVTLPPVIQSEPASPGVRKSIVTAKTFADHPSKLADPYLEPESEQSLGEFGLLGDLNTKIAPSGAAPKSTFFNTDNDDPIVPDLTESPRTSDVKTAKAEKSKQDAQLRCLPVRPEVKLLLPRPEVAASAYEKGDLEHPAVPGLMLSLEQRKYSVALEFINDESGEIRLETSNEKRFRITWKAPVKMTPSRTSSDFTEMDFSLFPGKK